MLILHDASFGFFLVTYCIFVTLREWLQNNETIFCSQILELWRDLGKRLVFRRLCAINTMSYTVCLVIKA